MYTSVMLVHAIYIVHGALSGTLVPVSYIVRVHFLHTGACELESVLYVHSLHAGACELICSYCTSGTLVP
jgi:hypothetical protein